MKKRVITFLILAWFVVGSLFIFEICRENTVELSSINESVVYIEPEDVIKINEKNEQEKQKQEPIINKKIIEPKQEVVSERTIEPEPVIQEVDYNEMLNNQLNKLPKNIVNLFYSSGWTISLTDENISDLYFGGKYKFVHGVTDYKNKKILIAKTEKSIITSVAHEFGHFIDYHFSFSSGTEEFKSIYEEEVELFKSNISNPGCVFEAKEFFAEEMFYLYTNPTKCTTRAKLYIENLISLI